MEGSRNSSFELPAKAVGSVLSVVVSDGIDFCVQLQVGPEVLLASVASPGTARGQENNDIGVVNGIDFYSTKGLLGSLRS